MTATPNPETRERMLVVLITLAGAAARAWSFGALGLSHFDEGIYAIAGLWTFHPRGLASLDPGVIPYAPPGFPVCVGVAYSVLGVADGVAILPAAVCGVLVIPLTAWVGRRTFGPGAGAAAAVFAALSVAAIAFSRKALTDMPFLACWLLAIATAGRFLERPGLGRAFALGSAVGLAQYFKYNGWLPGVVTAVAAVAGAVRHAEQRRPAAFARTFGFGLLAALIAAALYLPWGLFVERHGGYAALLRHHRGYVGGLDSWIPHWKSQLADAHALSGAPWFPALAWFAAWCCALLRARVTDGSQQRRDLVVMGIAGAAGLAALPNLAWWISLAACVPLLWAESAAFRVLGAWWLVLAVTTPFYTPYARLWLPTHAAGWVVLAAVAIAPSAYGGRAGDPIPRLPRPPAIVVFGCLFAALLHAGLTRPVALPTSWIFRPSSSLREATFALAPVRRTQPRRETFLVLARRPVAFYLTLGGHEVHLAENAAAFQRPAPPGMRAIVDDALLAEEKKPDAARQEIARNWMAEDRFVAPLDPVTLLDVHAEAAFELHPKRDYALSRLAPVRPSR